MICVQVQGRLPVTFNMADLYLRYDECSNKLKTFQALLKHFEQCQTWATFYHNDEVVQLTNPQSLRSPVPQAKYKA